MACKAPPGRLFATPDLAVDGLSRALADDNRMAFLEALSHETRGRHETKVLLGWPEVRRQLSWLAGSVSVVAVDYHYLPAFEPDGADYDWVWPTPDKPVARVRVRIPFEGEVFEEDLLFTREYGEPEPGTAASRQVRVGLDVYEADWHPNPRPWLQGDDDPDADRRTWRAVFPYQPFQGGSRFAQRVAAALSE